MKVYLSTIIKNTLNNSKDIMQFIYSTVLYNNRVTIQMKAIEQYFPVVLFFYAVQGGSNF